MFYEMKIYVIDGSKFAMENKFHKCRCNKEEIRK